LVAVRNIRKLGDPILRTKAKAVTAFDAELAKILEDMAETMEHNSGVGLAGPQIGLDLALVVIKLGEEFPLLELVNPRIVRCSGEEVEAEGCLSVPGVYGEVPRFSQVEVHFQDRAGRKKKLEASGYLARALQHELDHLQGILFIDKVTKYIDEGE
jgi:peptide deformylase